MSFTFGLLRILRVSYTGDETYDTVVGCAFALAVFIAAVAPFVPSPYGRFADSRLGPAVNARIGWWLMELPATVVFTAVYAQGSRRGETIPVVFAVIWSLHYFNRGWLQPWLMRPARGRPPTFSLLVIVCGWVVTGLHAYLHARYLSALGSYPLAWLWDARFLAGCALYAAALTANVHADAVTRGLRSAAEAAAGVRAYRIPRGGLFELVSCPAYLTELLAWAGLALATWSLAGVFILAVSAANLVPRAISTHRWYQRTFPDYPRGRCALIPGLL